MKSSDRGAQGTRLSRAPQRDFAVSFAHTCSERLPSTDPQQVVGEQDNLSGFVRVI